MPPQPPEDLIEPYRTELERLARPAVRLARTSHKTNSHFGGLPLVPADFIWPANGEGRPLAFLAQLDLAEVRAAAEIEWLPKAGTLLFFYDMIEEPWGDEPEQRSGWKVIYVEQGRARAEPTAPDAPVRTYQTSKLSILDPEVVRGILENPLRIGQLRGLVKVTKETQSEAVDVVFDRFDLEPSAFKSFPSFDDPAVQAVWPRSVDREELKEAYADFRAEELPRPQHQMDGYAVTVQEDGIEKLRARHEGWTLLLQLDSDEEGPGWMWGDCGLLYFLVRKDDARRGNFDDVWVILQCF